MISGDSSVAQGHNNAFYQMLRRFSAYWSRIDVISPPAPGAQPGVVHGNVHLHPAATPKLLQPYFIRHRGRALLRERDYALVTSHDYGFFLNGIGAWWLTRGSGVPYVSEIHHVEGYPRAVTLRERLYRAAAVRYIRWMSTRAAAVRVVNSQETPHLLRALGVPEEKILVLPSLYLDLEMFRPLPDVPKCYDVLFVGRLVANKGIFSLLEAFKLVRQTHPAARLSLLGQGPLRGAVEARISALGLRDAVKMTARLDNPQEVARLYNQSKMLVCASTAEGGPRVTVEAMACGTAVISTPVGVMPELLRDGENGFIWHWDVAELVQKIRRLLDDDTLRQQMGAAGRDAVGRFAADTVIAQYANGYHTLIARLNQMKVT